MKGSRSYVYITMLILVGAQSNFLQSKINILVAIRDDFKEFQPFIEKFETRDKAKEEFQYNFMYKDYSHNEFLKYNDVHFILGSYLGPEDPLIATTSALNAVFLPISYLKTEEQKVYSYLK